MNSSIFSIFIFLPAPLKMILIVVAGFSWFGYNRVEKVAAPRVQQKVIPAPKPAKVIEAVPVKAQAPLVITVNSDGSFGLTGKKLTEAQLTTRLKVIAAADPQRKIHLKADALTPYQMVVSAVKISQKAGLTNVSFSAKSTAP